MTLQRTLIRAHHAMTVTPYARPDSIPFGPQDTPTAECALEMMVAWLEVLSVVLRSHAETHDWELEGLNEEHPAVRKLLGRT